MIDRHTTIQINETNIPNLNLKGQGGKENEFSKILDSNNGWVRTSNNLYDYINNQTGTLLEIKKQQDKQWFDPSKYAQLTDQEKNITILFCLTDSLGKVDKIFTVNTQVFIDINFSQEELMDSFNYKKKYPKTQLKSDISIKRFFQNNQDVVTLIYQK